MKGSKNQKFVVCIRNDGYPASLEQRKLYRALPDAQAARAGMIRVIDESGEDYLYPADYFLPLTVSPSIQRALARAS
jgi:hypothetical protein